MTKWIAGLLACTCVTTHSAAQVDAKRVTLGTSTSVESSGLLARIKPAFERDTGYQLHAHTPGSGKAIQFAREGMVDVLLVHAPTAEREFLAQGYVERRIPYMSNFFLIVGPQGDPAKVGGLTDAREAFRRI